LNKGVHLLYNLTSAQREVFRLDSVHRNHVRSCLR